VHSFELKTESGGATDLAVFEALAQIRERGLQRFETGDVLVEHARKGTPSAEINLFPDERLQDNERRQIRALLDGAPA
jgi:hypothetical protein